MEKDKEREKLKRKLLFLIRKIKKQEREREMEKEFFFKKENMAKWNNTSKQKQEEQGVSLRPSCYPGNRIVSIATKLFLIGDIDWCPSAIH